MQIKDNKTDSAPRHSCEDQRTLQKPVLPALNKSSTAFLGAFTGETLRYFMQGKVWMETYQLFIRPSEIAGEYRRGVRHSRLSLGLKSSKLQTESNYSEFKSSRLVNETF